MQPDQRPFGGVIGAFLLLCIGVQIPGKGVQDLLTPVLHGVAAPR